MTELSHRASLAFERASRRWFAGVLLAVLVLLGAVACFVAWVDPFQQYHLSTRYAPRFYFLHHRYINPGLAKNQTYDTVVSGSSIMENTRNDFVGRVCGGTAVNLSMPAMSAAEQRLMLETAFANRSLRRVIAVLDFNEFAGAPDARQEAAGPLPRYLYQRNPFSALPYLLSWDTLLKAWRIVSHDTHERFTSDANAPWFWGNVVRFGRDQVLHGLDMEHLNARYQQPQRTLDGMRASFEHNLLPILRTHPETEFDIVWPPYSILVWVDFRQRDQLQVSLDFKRYVFEATRVLPNVHIVDLQSEAAVTHDLDRYDDIYHFDPAVNNWLIRAACGGGQVASAGTEEALERELREQVSAVSAPGGIAALAGGLKSITRPGD